MSRIKTVREYMNTYKNWPSVLFGLLTRKDFINVVLKTKSSLRIPPELVYAIKELSLRQISAGKENYFTFDISSGIFTFKYDDVTVKINVFKDGKVNGEFSSFADEYLFLEPIKGNIVIDIGANIADSGIWFALEGAYLTLALEPYKYNYEMAIKNINLNKLEDKVQIINAAYGVDRTIKVEDKIANTGTVLKEYKNGLEIPVFSIQTILSRFIEEKNMNLLLKMDCEGCEYNILNESDQILNRFSKIIIEYHKGYEKLKEKLEHAGFIVTYTQPRERFSNKTKERLIQGYLYAKRSILE